VSFMSWLRNLLAPEPPRLQAAELGRNDPCWCGSGKKYKKCHLSSDEANQREAKYSAQTAAQRRRQEGIVPQAGAKKPARPQQEWKGGADSAGR
jgi:hypothetical protein